MNTYRDRLSYKFVIYRALTALGVTFILALPVFGIKNAVLFSILLIGALLPIMLFFIWLDYISLKLLFKKHHIVDYAIKQEREIEVKAPIGKTYEYVLSKLKKAKGLKNVEGFKSDWTIRARTRMSWKSYGERITLQFSKGSPTTTILCISSEPTVKKTVMDCGQNYANVERIKSLLSNIAVKV